jgi:hypothetical protein
MSRAAVFLAWGKPDRIRYGIRQGHSLRSGFIQLHALRFRRVLTILGCTGLDIFAVGFGGITTISILLASIHIPLIRILKSFLMKFPTKLSISKEIVALDLNI